MFFCLCSQETAWVEFEALVKFFSVLGKFGLKKFKHLELFFLIFGKIISIAKSSFQNSSAIRYHFWYFIHELKLFKVKELTINQLTNRFLHTFHSLRYYFLSIFMILKILEKLYEFFQFWSICLHLFLVVNEFITFVIVCPLL